VAMGAPALEDETRRTAATLLSGAYQENQSLR